jgi:predicted regulator of Ras-like GTPase activity (Roadblock/LC7/MglB family)
MSFEDILHEILSECGGGLGIALMGSDGIPISQITAQLEGGAPNPLGEDIGVAGVEFARILSEIQKASDALNAGAMAETVINLAAFQLLFRRVDEDVILILALSHKNGNPGKARYLIRRHLVGLRQEL